LANWSPLIDLNALSVIDANCSIDSSENNSKTYQATCSLSYQ
jgi:hypothetical protein